MVITGRRCLKNGTCNFGEGRERKGVRGIGEMEMDLSIVEVINE